VATQTNAVTPVQASALDWLAQSDDMLSRDHQTIWRLAETAWREYRSAAWYVDRLRREGFDVEVGSGGMPTAFCATWGKKGPVIAGYAEYDAVPGQSQEPVPYKTPRAGTTKHTAGHTDPHSALGIGAFAGFLAAKQAMEKNGIEGRLRFFGEPAEKMCGSKPVHAAHGYYDGIDAAISFHPQSFGGVPNGALGETQCAPYWSRIYTFECDEPETWNQPATPGGIQHTHGSARAPGAIDAVVLMYVSSKVTKENMLPHHGSWTVNEFILTAGQAAADNLAPRLGQIQYSARVPTLAMAEQIFAVLDKNAEHAAAISHCTVRKGWVTKTRAGLPNLALARITHRNLTRVGGPVWNEAAVGFAREIQRNLGLEPMTEPFLPDNEKIVSPDEGEAWFRAQLPAWQTHYAADDYVEYTWHAPTVRLYIARAALREPRPGYRYPDWTRYAMNGYPATIDPMWRTAGRCISATILDLLTNPAQLDECRREFEERTGGGVGGTKWVAPLLPRDFPAPVDYRWPEYVDTPRGPQWSVTG
jgi:aminobenzoyl-glutamate utilization protein B